MPKPAIDASRIGTYTAELERLHLWGTDEEIDREFNSVCRTIWGYTVAAETSATASRRAPTLPLY
jgi:hypothetical protein